MKTMHDKTICGNFPSPFQKLLNGVDITEGTSRKKLKKIKDQKIHCPFMGGQSDFKRHVLPTHFLHITLLSREKKVLAIL